ncbi:regulatory protein, tetR family [Paraoerskovia marina]|uniref:Regulatory protein, tetR family n=1 Tax=Paraoerskovia marina TaxID=545619 RepID=A0A1H1MYD7_9CELL|nr:TetR/AcrR family transcriptional regulator [Paraoerskovia marina]SDR91608.1 regulatory protein, tetR family [Paraoerskovia marina]
MTEPSIDRRAAAKARTRHAIVDAASTLMDRTQGVDFSVDELAAEADVARRTVFNHFDSLDDVVAAVGSGGFARILDALRDEPVVPGEDVAADLAAAIRRADLIDPLVSLSRGFGLVRTVDENVDRTCMLNATHPEIPQRPAMLLLRSLAEVSELLVAELSERHPGSDAIAVELSVSRQVSELVVLHKYWLAATGAADDQASAETWSDLLSRLDTPTVASATTD